MAETPMLVGNRYKTDNRPLVAFKGGHLLLYQLQGTPLSISAEHMCGGWPEDEGQGSRPTPNRMITCF